MISVGEGAAEFGTLIHFVVPIPVNDVGKTGDVGQLGAVPPGMPAPIDKTCVGYDGGLTACFPLLGLAIAKPMPLPGAPTNLSYEARAFTNCLRLKWCSRGIVVLSGMRICR